MKLAILSTAIEGILKPLLDLIPNANERARAKEAAEKSLLDMIAKSASEQAEINKQEAAHKSLFVAGWRPFIGWVCGSAFVYHYVLQPFAVTIASVVAQYAEIPFDVTQLPSLEMDTLMTVLLGMLGLGGLRTMEKIKGCAREK
jgi:hypothetical protein